MMNGALLSELLPAVETQGPYVALALMANVSCYLVARTLHRRCQYAPWANPVFIGITLMIGLILALQLDYLTYFRHSRILHTLLGTATVALAIPMYAQLRQSKQALSPLLVAMTCGSVIGVASAVLITHALDGHPLTHISMLTKSVTTPVAMALTSSLGGEPALSAVIVIATGILGAVLGPLLLRLKGLNDPAGMGTALGTAAHGIGTAAGLQMNQTVGAYAGLAMSLNAVLTAIVLPLFAALF
jgi:putative effector of murein hydrolase